MIETSAPQQNEAGLPTGNAGVDLFVALLIKTRNDALEEAARVCWDYSAKRDGDCSKNYAKGFNHLAHDDGVAARAAETLCSSIRALKTPEKQVGTPATETRPAE